ncbi:hypothetical protein KEM52_003058 [Ascosphaera acerosa]|nr:hypothetical protein KEM52_003058 [Ascosphaera acerosa]
MGVLVGTSLVVIIPEGVETLYSSVAVAAAGTPNANAAQAAGGQKIEKRSDARVYLAGHDAPRLRVRLRVRDGEGEGGSGSESESDGHAGGADGDSKGNGGGDGDSDGDSDGEFAAAVVPGSGSPHDPPQPAEISEGEVHILDENGGDTTTGTDTDTGTPPTPSSPHTWIGISLLAGFVLMYLIDKLPQLTTIPFLTRRRRALPHHISLDNLASSPLSSAAGGPSAAGAMLGGGGGLAGGLSAGSIGAAPLAHPDANPLATTTGLVIHAAADGIALGSSTSSADAKLSVIIFLAVILHKAPAAFALASVLMQQGLTRRAVRAHLLVFSLAAPLGAVATWFVAHTLFAAPPAPSDVAAAAGAASAHEASVHWRTGVLLLFSAGTFLYVAMHTMQEVSSGASAFGSGSGHGHEWLGSGSMAGGSAGLYDGADGFGSGYYGGGASGRAGGSSSQSRHALRELVASVVGMVLPLVLQVHHAH